MDVVACIWEFIPEGRVKKSLIIVLLSCLFSSTSSAYGVEKGLLDSLGLQELSQEAPDFTLINPGGQKITLKDYRGKVVIINIWATWCVPCKEEFPLFEKMYQRIVEKNMVFLPISIDIKATQDEINAFAKEQTATFPVYLARMGNVTGKYWTWGVPVTYFINKKGWIVGRAIGPRDWSSDNVNGLINALLEEK